MESFQKEKESVHRSWQSVKVTTSPVKVFSLTKEKFQQKVQILPSELGESKREEKEKHGSQNQVKKTPLSEEISVPVTENAAKMKNEAFETAPRVAEKKAEDLGSLDSQVKENDKRFHVVRFLTKPASPNTLLPDDSEIAAFTDSEKSAALCCCLESNGLANFLFDPLPSWLNYFCISREAYLRQQQKGSQMQSSQR